MFFSSICKWVLCCLMIIKHFSTSSWFFFIELEVGFLLLMIFKHLSWQKLIFSNQNHELVFVCKCSWCPGRNQKNGLKRLSPRWLICSYAFPLCYKLTIKLQILLISMGSTLVFVYCVRKNRALCFSARYPCYFSLPDDRIEEPKAHTTHVFTRWVLILVILKLISCCNYTYKKKKKSCCNYCISELFAVITW